MIACSMPGKIGDALYAFPVIKYLTQQYGKADFYTATYCEPMRSLIEYQPYINKFIAMGPGSGYDYHFGWGIHPVEMPIDRSKYDQVFELGYRSFPHLTYVQFGFWQIGMQMDAPSEGVFNYPDKTFLSEDYIVIAPRRDPMFEDSMRGVIEKSPVAVVQIGAKGEAWEGGIDMTGLSFLDTVSLLAKAKGFYGLISSQAALAHNFDFPKVFPHNGGGWDMRHVIKSPTSFYCVFPNADRVLALLGLK